MSKIKVLRMALAGSTVAVMAAPIVAGAATANTTVNAVIGSTISITTSNTVNLNITPVSGGNQTTQSDTVTINTNNSGGYTLTLQDVDANTNLVNGGNTIATSSSVPATPAALSNNTWGWRVDGLSGFGAGPTSGSTDQGTNTTTFAGMPANGSAFTLKTTATTATNDVTTVWYSAKADTTKPNGTYADSVLYTATTN